MLPNINAHGMRLVRRSKAWLILAAGWFAASACPVHAWQVQTGLDRMLDTDFQQLQGKTVAILTHQSAVDRHGTHLLETLPAKRNFRIKALLAPEHGFYGKLDTEHIGDDLEPETGLTIYSLYGKTRKPTAEMLDGIDCLIIDLQDIGTRFYTYQTTLLRALEACAEYGVAAMVLDRPNPLGGEKLSGPVLQEAHFSFTGAFPMPIVHGMTMGELATMFVAERHLSLDLEVVKIKGWRRTGRFSQTGLFWVDPSPNMRRPTQAILYPAVGVLEYANLSVGRGTDTPFEVLGAPWIDASGFARRLTRENLPGISFVPRRFQPSSGPYAGEVCGGVILILENPERFEPMHTTLAIFGALRTDYSNQFQPKKVLKLLGHTEVFEAMLKGQSTAVIDGLIRPDLDKFRTLRRKYLLY